MGNGKAWFIDDEVLVEEDVNINDAIGVYATYALVSASHLALYRLSDTQ